MRVLFIVDPLSSLHLAGDTSYALMLEAAARGWDVWTCQPVHLGLEHNAAIALAERTRVTSADAPGRAFTTEAAVPMPLADFAMVWMRKDPPLDTAYLHATWILEHARGQTLLINDPHGLRELNEHLAVLRFPSLTPPTVVSASPQRLREFLREQDGAIVIKPVDGYAGLGVFLVRTGDPNLSSLLETATSAGTRYVVAQRYLPEAMQGDKRIVLVRGEPVGAVLRVPPANEARGNLHVGGRAVKTDITERDREIIAAVAPTLLSLGQVFVGLDVIGGYLTELNITSPTGIRQISALDGRNVAADVMTRLAAGLA